MSNPIPIGQQPSHSTYMRMCEMFTAWENCSERLCCVYLTRLQLYGLYSVSLFKTNYINMNIKGLMNQQWTLMQKSQKI